MAERRSMEKDGTVDEWLKTKCEDSGVVEKFKATSFWSRSFRSGRIPFATTLLA
jgi:hypothetical protein